MGQQSISIENIEDKLLFLVNEYLDDVDVYLSDGEYFRVNFNIWTPEKIKSILKTFGFKFIGNVSDFPEILPQQDTFNDSDVQLKFTDINKINVSEKYNAILVYTVYKYYIRTYCLIDKKHYKKFNKKLNKLLSVDKHSGIFNNVDFTCKKKEYIEISDVLSEEDKLVTVQVKKVPDECLVFDRDSEIFNVMEDIKLFFKPATKELYDRMKILYKRGIIIHGDPGNGKTAMIRELIRQLKDVTCIIINPNTPRITFVLSELLDSLKGKQVIIVIEDIDAVINHNNRSELLNILDGVNMKSGIYFIGTTNYPEKIDPAFVNRAGRFDRSYKIPNPNETVRRAFFNNAKIGELLRGYKIYKNDSENTQLSITDLFVKYSVDLSMANLKELMISTQYMLITNKNISIEEALEINFKTLIENKKEHDDAYNSNVNERYPRYTRYQRYE